jgi:ketosteroid isomerase-like protein
VSSTWRSSRRLSGDLAYTAGHERARASFDGGPIDPIRLRVTHLYRRENGEWKIVHRHADPLETSQITPTAEQR